MPGENYNLHIFCKIHLIWYVINTHAEWEQSFFVLNMHLIVTHRVTQLPVIINVHHFYSLHHCQIKKCMSCFRKSEQQIMKLVFKIHSCKILQKSYIGKQMKDKILFFLLYHNDLLDTFKCYFMIFWFQRIRIKKKKNNNNSSHMKPWFPSY